MNTRATVTINGPADREQICRWAQKIELGTVVTFRKKSRSTEQSAKMWAMLHEVAEQVDWYGTKMDAEDWKDCFTASLRHARVVPGIDKGTYVPLGMHTSTMTIEEMTNLIELIYAFGADPAHPVVFKEPKTDTNSEARPLTSEADTSTSKVSAEADELSPSSSASDLHSGSKTGQVEPDTAGGGETSPSSATDRENAILIRYARDVLSMAADMNVSPAVLKAVEKRWAAEELSKLSDGGKDQARAISVSMRAIANDPARLDGVLEHYADVLDTTVEELRGEA